jgi:hypothetical protein
MNNYPDFLIYIASILWGEVKTLKYSQDLVQKTNTLSA